MGNYPETKLVGVAYKLRKKMKNSLSCAHVLHKSLNVVISRCCFAEDGKEMYQNVKRTCLNLLFCGVVVAVAVAFDSRNLVPKRNLGTRLRFFSLLPARDMMSNATSFVIESVVICYRKGY